MFTPFRLNEDQNIALERHLDEQGRQNLINRCVQTIIVLGQNEAPIKRADLNRLVFVSIGSRIVPNAIVQLANNDLNQLFGLRLFETDDRSKLFLVNTKPGFAQGLQYSDNECEEFPVLYYTLMGIFASIDQKKSEEDLIEDLSALDCGEEIIKTHLDNFVKKSYLNLERQPEARFYSWGPRAVAEVEPDDFFEEFLKLAGDNESKRDWPELEKRVQKLKSLPYR